MAEAASAVPVPVASGAGESRGGAMAEARKRLRGAGRAIESHHTADCDWRPADRQRQQTLRLGKLKARSSRVRVGASKSEPICVVTRSSQSSGAMGDMSTLRHGNDGLRADRHADPGFAEADAGGYSWLNDSKSLSLDSR